MANIVLVLTVKLFQFKADWYVTNVVIGQLQDVRCKNCWSHGTQLGAGQAGIGCYL